MFGTSSVGTQEMKVLRDNVLTVGNLSCPSRTVERTHYWIEAQKQYEIVHFIDKVNTVTRDRMNAVCLSVLYWKVTLVCV